MIAPSDGQLDAIMTAARHVPHQQRGVYLESIAAYLKALGREFGDGDVFRALKVARATVGNHWRDAV